MEYQTKLETTLKTMKNQENVNSMWKVIRDAITQTTRTVIGERKNRKRNNWFDEECDKALKSRNDAQQQMLQNPNDENTQAYREARTIARKTLKVKKKANDEKLLEELESSRINNKTIKFFHEVKNIKTDFKPEQVH